MPDMSKLPGRGESRNMSDKTLQNAAENIGENVPGEGEETFPAGFAPREGFTKVATTSRATMTRRATPYNAALERWATSLMTTYGGEEALRGKDGGLVVTIEDFPGIFRDEETYRAAKVALRDWLVLHGWVEAKGEGAAKGTFRMGGTWSSLITRGEHAGESNRYGEQIRVTRVK